MASFAQNSSGRVIEYWYMASYSFIFEPSASPCDGTISTLFAVAAAPESTAASAPDMSALRGVGVARVRSSSGTHPVRNAAKTARFRDGAAGACRLGKTKHEQNKIR